MSLQSVDGLRRGNPRAHWFTWFRGTPGRFKAVASFNTSAFRLSPSDFRLAFQATRLNQSIEHSADRASSSAPNATKKAVISIVFARPMPMRALNCS